MTSAPTSDDGRLLAVFPFYSDNEWHELVYFGVRRRGHRVLGVGPFFSVEELKAQLGGRLPHTLHLGWSTPVTQVVPDVIAAMQRVLAFIEAVRHLKAAGVRIVWTVHNVISHESPHVTPELAFHRFLAEIADAVHIMNPMTIDIVAPLYRLRPETVVQISHPSYEVEPANLRGRTPGPTRLLMFGEIRPYKGVFRFAELIDRARRAGVDVELDVVGRVGGALSDDVVRQRLAQYEGVRFEPGYVEPSRVPQVFAHADALVLPYEAGLNSGVALLAGSYGVPVFVGASLRDTWPMEQSWQIRLWGEGADGGGKDDLSVLREAVDHLDRQAGELRKCALKAARDRGPERLSARYLDLFLPSE